MNCDGPYITSNLPGILILGIVAVMLLVTALYVTRRR